MGAAERSRTGARLGALAPALLAFVGAAGGATLVHVLVPTPGREPPVGARALDPATQPSPAASTDGPDAMLLASILERLGGLEDALARLEARAALAPEREVAAAGDSAAPSGGPTALANGLEALRESVEALRGEIALHSGKELPPTLEEIRAGRDSIDWGFIEELYAQWAVLSQRRLAEDRLRFLPYGEVLRTIGRPTSIGGNGEWTYSRPPSPQERNQPRALALTFRGGYVTGMTMR